MSRWTLVIITLALGACHEADDTEDRGRPIDSDNLALACEADLTCPGGGTCDPRTLKCVDCAADSDCAAGVCDPRANVCVQCVDDGDCQNGVCHPTRALCVGCWNDSQCGSGICHPDRLACIECLSDGDCARPDGPGHCNTETFACTGECRRDVECDDNDDCTTDVCDAGTCLYRKEAGCGCAVVPPCLDDARPIDSDADLCVDACVCNSGQVVAPGQSCQCPVAPVCPVDTKPFDRDQDGCFDACTCPNGALVGPDGQCPCFPTISCGGGLVPSDLNADGCTDTCTKPCATDCDCIGQGLVSDALCNVGCTDCGATVVCDGGICAGQCGELRPGACECPPPPACGPLESAIDTDADGCNDTCDCIVSIDDAPFVPDPNGTTQKCGCLAAIDCGAASHPIDRDDDGCFESCACDDPLRAAQPDGSCCPALACPPGAVAKDVGGDSCPDVCTCPDGRPAEDGCFCADGSLPGPNGCDGCLATCADTALPPQTIYVDVDKDGCYDVPDVCAVGTQAARSVAGGCPDTCRACEVEPACPIRAVAVDTNGDNCADDCVCPDDQKAAPASGCGCVELTCGAGTVAVDRNGDGCPDDCAAPCVTPCDCSRELAESAAMMPQCATDCVDCTVVGSCVEGFCAFDCSAAASPGTSCIVVGDAPVCGCDDRTYESSCAASQANVSVKRDGACETSGCTTDADCATGQLCELPTGACEGDAEPAIPNDARGECQPIPSACLSDGGQVCGCDGKTYLNDCERRKAGVARARVGACELR